MPSQNVGCFLSLLQEISLTYLPLSSSIFPKPRCAVSFVQTAMKVMTMTMKRKMKKMMMMKVKMKLGQTLSW